MSCWRDFVGPWMSRETVGGYWAPPRANPPTKPESPPELKSLLCEATQRTSRLCLILFCVSCPFEMISLVSKRSLALFTSALLLAMLIVPSVAYYEESDDSEFMSDPDAEEYESMFQTSRSASERKRGCVGLNCPLSDWEPKCQGDECNPPKGTQGSAPRTKSNEKCIGPQCPISDYERKCQGDECTPPKSTRGSTPRPKSNQKCIGSKCKLSDWEPKCQGDECTPPDASQGSGTRVKQNNKKPRKF